MLMLTVEHTTQKVRSAPQDAINAWIEFDGATDETYVCLREMTNWDGEHKGINVVRKISPKALKAMSCILHISTLK